VKVIKNSVLVIGLLVAFVVGVWVSPRVTPWMSRPAELSPAANASTETPKAITPAAAHARQSPKAAREGAAITPALTARVEPLMTRGTNMQIAERGIGNGREFAALAHASRNLDVPFVLLKDKVVTHHESLTRAIHDLKPDVNASIEATRADAEARSDLAQARRTSQIGA
jgi:hypothetical protein